MAWARQRDSATLTGAMRGAAVNDFERAVELSLDVLRTDSAPIIPFIESGVGDVARLADRLRPSPDPMLQRQLSRLVNFWSQYDAEAALEWAVANADTDPALVRLVAGAGGRHRPELAIAAAERAPAALRDVWISGVAGGLAAADVERALVFLESHRGEPSYESGVANIVRTLAENDPVRAAQILERADDLPAARDVAPRIAVVWAQRDPAAAAAWASGLSDPDVQMGAVMNVAPLYVRTAPDAAVDWLLDLPEGQARDLGLSTAASTTAASSTALAERMLAAIGDDKIRAGAAVSAAVAIGRTDQDAARQFAEKWIPEPQLRRQVEQRLAEERGGTDGSAVFRSGVDIPR